MALDDAAAGDALGDAAAGDALEEAATLGELSSTGSRVAKAVFVVHVSEPSSAC